MAPANSKLAGDSPIKGNSPSSPSKRSFEAMAKYSGKFVGQRRRIVETYLALVGDEYDFYIVIAKIPGRDNREPFLLYPKQSIKRVGDYDTNNPWIKNGYLRVLTRTEDENEDTPLRTDRNYPYVLFIGRAEGKNLMEQDFAGLQQVGVNFNHVSTVRVPCSKKLYYFIRYANKSYLSVLTHDCTVNEHLAS